MAALILSLILFIPGNSFAKVTGRCDNCHTMHYSQGGAVLAAWGSAGPYNNCLVNSCVGCHTGANTGSNTTPYVMATSAPTFGTNTLAGGNFWWVATAGGNDSAKGHNVLGVSTQDGNISAAAGAPGGAPGTGPNCANSCHLTLAVAQTALSTFGSGCEGCHLEVKHHTDDGTGTKYVSAYPWYRFLAGHSGGGTITAGYGVQGIEHSGWGYGATVGGTNHNEYKGVDDWHEINTALSGDIGGTMTGYCCGCHGNFHIQDATRVGASPWLRHPSDAVIPSTAGSEYASMDTQYNPNTPVARPSGFNWAGNTPSGTVAAGTDMVMCLSCHVAHGSPNDDMLRWPYSGMIAGGGGADGTGCFVCHTTKDD